MTIIIGLPNPDVHVFKKNKNEQKKKGKKNEAFKVTMQKIYIIKLRQLSHRSLQKQAILKVYSFAPSVI